MLVQACLNGRRAAGFHPALPLTPAALAADAAACVAAGAAELHVHPRGADGSESLNDEAVGAALQALRAACPGALIGVTTGDWIAGPETAALIATWRALPDHASVNLSEPEAPAVMRALLARGIAIEAGVASVGDVRRLLALPEAGRVLRVLVEIAADDEAAGQAAASAVLDALTGFAKPVLLHGFDATMWPLLTRARASRLSTRVGLEDGHVLPSGATAADNAALVRAAVSIQA